LIRELNLRPEPIKILEENVRVKLHISLGDDFFLGDEYHSTNSGHKSKK
jgi:hypothetical protein